MRHRPKKWPAPKSRRTRDRAAQRRLGWKDSFVAMRIVKHMWPSRGEPERWALLAYKRGWISLCEYIAIPLDLSKKGPLERFYEMGNPLFKLLKKEPVPVPYGPQT